MNRSRLSPSCSGLLALCVLLWLGGLIFAGLGIYFLLNGHALFGLASFLSAAGMAACGLGLYRQKRWGVILFGLLSAFGSLNYLVSTLLRYADLSQASLGIVLSALVSITAAILVPTGLFYLTLLLWRRTE